MSVYYLLSLMPVIPHTWSHFNLRTFLAGWRGGGCTLLSLPPWTAYHRCETTAPGYVTIVLPTFVLFLIVVQSLSCVWLFVTPWTEASQASLSFIISQSLLKLMSIESVMSSNHLILCFPFSPPALNLFQHWGLFQWVGFSHQVAKVLELQHQSFQWIFKVDFL